MHIASAGSVTSLQPRARAADAGPRAAALIAGASKLTTLKKTA